MIDTEKRKSRIRKYARGDKAKACLLRYRNKHRVLATALGLCSVLGCPNKKRDGRKMCERCAARSVLYSRGEYLRKIQAGVCTWGGCCAVASRGRSCDAHAASNSKSSLSSRARIRAAGRCPSCGASLGGRATFCQGCAAKAVDRARIRRLAKIAAGKCTHGACDSDPEPGIQRCKKHRIVIGPSVGPRKKSKLHKTDSRAECQAYTRNPFPVGLSERQEMVIRLSSHQTLQEIGTVLGITRERVRQIQVEALSKIRSAESEPEQ